MKYMGCTSVSRVLEAFHDGELPVGEQIAVESHLSACFRCSSDARSLRVMRDTLRAGADVAMTPDVDARLSGLTEAVVSRVKAERQEALPARVSRMFEDLHLVWAALAASTATVTCAAVVGAVLYFAPPERADSLAGVLSAFATPGSDRNPVRPDDFINLPRFEEAAINTMPTFVGAPGTGDDVALTVSGVLTRSGHVAYPELHPTSPYSIADTRKLIDAVGAVRFEPATRGGMPIAVNLIWLLEQTTVRGKMSS